MHTLFQVSVTGIVKVTCPACGRMRDCKLVQSINSAAEPEAKAKLLAGELNVLACDCGARTQLAAKLVYRDPDRDFTAQVVPDGSLAEAAAMFDAAGMTGTRRVVPSQNALVEKIRILDAGLEDWKLEMVKTLLLASLGGLALEEVLLFERVEAGAIHWLRFGPDGLIRTASTLAQYAKLGGAPPHARELQIDRAWAIAAVDRMIHSAN